MLASCRWPWPWRPERKAPDWSAAQPIAVHALKVVFALMEKLGFPMGALTGEEE